MIHSWWHKFIRKRSRPIEPNRALVWKQRLSIAYGVLAWNAFGMILFLCYQGKGDWAHYYGLKTDEEKAVPPARQWAATLGIQNAKVFRISGLTKVDEYDIVEGNERRSARNSTTKEEFEE